MAGAGKKRQQKARKGGNGNGNGNGDSNGSKPSSDPKHKSSSSSSDSPEGKSSSDSPPKNTSPPSAMDGNRDPGAGHARTASQGSQGGQQPTGAVSVGIFQNRNLDLGVQGTSLVTGGAQPRMPLRPNQQNPTGKNVQVRLNTWNVLSMPTKPVYQYDVKIGTGNEKRGLLKRVWNSRALHNRLRQGQGQGQAFTWLWDGNKLAWSLTSVREIRIAVDLDQEDGRNPRTDRTTGQPRPDVHNVIITQSKVVKFDSLGAWLRGDLERMDNDCLESLNVCDHIMREGPSRLHTVIRRSFFPHDEKRETLGGGLEVRKGVYASIRPVHAGRGQPSQLSVNADVSNTAFWEAGALPEVASRFMKCRGVNDMVERVFPRQRSTTGGPSEGLRWLNRLKGVQIYTRHRGEEQSNKEKKSPLIIHGFLNQDADNHRIKPLNPDTGREEEMSIREYFRRKYNFQLQFPKLPLVQMTKKTIVLPMELCFILDHQRFKFKLSSEQTTNMLKHAAVVPERRWSDIEAVRKKLNWESDRYLKEFGLSISSQATSVKAQILPNPKVVFAAGGRDSQVNPGTSGRWDLRGKKFLVPHPGELVSWGVGIMPGRFKPTVEQVRAFMAEFKRAFIGHGGKIKNDPVIVECSGSARDSVNATWVATGNKNKQAAQILFFIVDQKVAEPYLSIKKAMDITHGAVSQVLLSTHVGKAQAQYCSNVSMKVNAKLGGVTAHAQGLRGAKSWFTVPTLVIGADVSHGAALASEPTSIAAMTFSWDRHAIKYAAGVAPNGSRVELITDENIDKLVGFYVKGWLAVVSNGNPPKQIFYFRDGVSEGQYTQVLDQEVKAIRAAINKAIPRTLQEQPKITVAVGTKRHHVRFFPEDAQGRDKNQNALPGTLVETGVTHPREYDFYLCAHSAIKGTARPVHYYVLLDENNLSVDALQNMIYEASYQYVRSTTPVSLFPAVYYAHLAAARATAHFDRAPAEGQQSRGGSVVSESENMTMVPMGGANAFKSTMWFV